MIFSLLMSVYSLLNPPIFFAKYLHWFTKRFATIFVGYDRGAKHHLRIWNGDTAESLTDWIDTQPKGNARDTSRCVFTKDGRHLLTVTVATIRKWDAATGELSDTVVDTDGSQTWLNSDATLAAVAVHDVHVQPCDLADRRVDGVGHGDRVGEVESGQLGLGDRELGDHLLDVDAELGERRADRPELFGLRTVEHRTGA